MQVIIHALHRVIKIAKYQNWISSCYWKLCACKLKLFTVGCTLIFLTLTYMYVIKITKWHISGNKEFKNTIVVCWKHSECWHLVFVEHQVDGLYRWKCRVWGKERSWALNTHYGWYQQQKVQSAHLSQFSVELYCCPCFSAKKEASLS